jgi:hypothetical protein
MESSSAAETMAQRLAEASNKSGNENDGGHSFLLELFITYE